MLEMHGVSADVSKSVHIRPVAWHGKGNGLHSDARAHRHPNVVND